MIDLTFSLPPGSSDHRTCSNTWDNSCDSGSLNDAFNSSWNGTHDLGCSGVQNMGAGSGQDVQEVYLNATLIKFGDAINATCQFYGGLYSTTNGTEWMFYYNGTEGGWMELGRWNDTDNPLNVTNRTVVFIPNNTVGTHWIRCSYRQNVFPTDFCANWTGEADFGIRDNDDVNFTVTDYPKYDSWNVNVSDYTELNRSDAILAYAHWDRNVSFVKIRHNGTGSFQNYSILSPYPGNWTNYTLNLSNVTEFSQVGVIEVSYIWVNNTDGLENYTSPAHYFNLSAGNPPNATNFWFSYSEITINITNKYTNLTIYANVSDDAGLNTVIANITYPDGNSTNATMQGEQPYLNEWKTWNYTFGNDLHLNTTGNYTVRIIAKDLGNQEKASGVDHPVENMSFYVNDTYTLNFTSNYTLYMRGENVTIQALDVNNLATDNVNWIVNVTKINETYNFTPQATTFNYTILTNDSVGNYSILANASRDNNTGNSSWDFNVSRKFIISFTTTSSPMAKGSPFNVNNIIVLNARGTEHVFPFNVSISCNNGGYEYTLRSLSFTNNMNYWGQCYSPNSYSTPFNVTVSVSDQYNNTGQYIVNLSTVEETITYIGGGGGGFAPPAKEAEKKCEDGTLYNQCSPDRPLYCSNGTLIKYCSVCGCESGYGCQPDESCIITKEEDFNFIINLTEIEITQGESKEITSRLINTGNTILNLISFLNVSKSCCNISIPSSFELNEREEKEFQIVIRIPLSANVREYPMKIGIGTEYFKKERTINIIVRKSYYHNSLSDMEIELKNLEELIEEYKKVGIDTRDLETLIGYSKVLLNNANESISTDEIIVLENSLSDLKNNIVSVRSSLNSLMTQRFLLENGWLVGLLLIMGLTTMYLVPAVLIPLSKKEKELLDLKREEEALVISRVETEKQYFMRKIDEKTFNGIMIKKQDRILKVRGLIKENEKEKEKIIKSMSPAAMFTWFGRGIKSIPKRLLKRKKKNNIDKNGKTE